jgi:hypothetical protein
VNGRKRVLVVYLGELEYVSRVLRQIEFLASEHDVVVAAFDEPSLPVGVKTLKLTPAAGGSARRRLEAAVRVVLRAAGAYRSAYWFDARVRRWRSELALAMSVDAIVINDLFPLPLALSVARDSPVVLDAHEHWTSESASWTKFQRASMRRAHEWIVDQVPRTAGIMTVSAGISRDYFERTGVRPAIVTNAPLFRELTPSEVEEPIRLLHIGIADERRRLEDTIEAVGLLNGRFTLDLVLRRDNAYRRRLERLAATHDGVRVLAAVAADQLIPFASDYDVGVFLLPADFPNQVHVLPNKLFDYIQARLAIAIGPSPEMAEVVTEWDCGVVSSAFTARAFAEVLADLTIENVERMKRNADRAARVLTAENNRETLLRLVRDATL